VGGHREEDEDVSVLSEIQAERKRQDEKWGGAGHDDEHDAQDWLDFIAERRTELMRYLTQDDDRAFNRLYRRYMVEIAALSVAAIESHDRRTRG
jgi:hypothetical protein